MDPLRHCLSLTGCKLIVVDPERANILEPITTQLKKEAGTVGFLVLDTPNSSWKGMEPLDKLVDTYSGDHGKSGLLNDQIDPEDNATIIFTSGISTSSVSTHQPTLRPVLTHKGTTGLPKGVLSTQRQFLTNVLNVSYLQINQSFFRSLIQTPVLGSCRWFQSGCAKWGSSTQCPETRTSSWGSRCCSPVPCDWVNKLLRSWHLSQNSFLSLA